MVLFALLIAVAYGFLIVGAASFILQKILKDEYIKADYSLPQ